MKIINQNDIDKIVEPKEMVEVVAKAFGIYGKGEFAMPERYGFEEGGMTFLYMPCFTEHACGTKMLALVPENRERRLPSIDGVVVLNDRTTGQSKALLDAKRVTSWRTGATGALAARELSNENAASVGIVGCGVQGFSQGVCISAVRNIKKICLFDPFKPEDALKQYAEDLQKAAIGNPEMIICKSAEELLSGSDIVVTTTFATGPVLPEEPELLKGKCYIAVGSYKPYMKELPDSLFEITEDVYVDLPYACEESGDLSTRIEKGLLDEKNVKCLHNVLDGSQPKPASDTVVFKTVGMALVDLAAAEYICETAEKENIGVEVEF